MAIREGKWDCSNCLTRRIKGRFKDCPNCGDPRNPDLTPEEKPYLPTDAEEVTDPSLLQLAHAGPDWNCGHCGEANRGDAMTCANCSCPRDADDKFARVITYLEGKPTEGVAFDPRTREEDERVADLISDDDEHEKLLSDRPNEPDRPKPLTLPTSALRRDGEIAVRADSYLASPTRNNPAFQIWELHKPKVLISSGILGLIVVIWGIYGAFIKTETVQLEVANLTWERQVEIEAYRTLTEQDWHLPQGGRLVRQFRDVHHYDRVLDHYERKSRQVSERVQTGSRSEQYACGSRTVDKGNGFFETETQYCSRSVTDYETRYRTEHYDDPVYVDVPVYQTKYEYQIDRWVTERWEVASGKSGEPETKPYWPEPRNVGTNQRVGDERREEYVVVLEDEDGRTFRKEPGYRIWAGLRNGTDLTGQVNRRGNLKRIDWPEKANK